MSKTVILETGLFTASEPLEAALLAALANAEPESVLRVKLDHHSMTDRDWDTLLEHLLLANSVISV